MSVLGSFWSGTYEGSGQIESLVRAKCELENQTLLDVLDAIATVSRVTVPIFRKQNWHRLVLKESDRNSVATSLIRYDTGYDHDTGVQYDVPSRQYGFAFPLPTPLADARVILNRMSAPSLVWTRGVDYAISTQDAALIFVVDPFEDGRFTISPVFNAVGEEIDREVTLWVFRGDFDFDSIYRQFGYAIQLRMQSSAGYRDIVNTVFDAYVGGTTREHIVAGLSTVTGIPLVREAEETVEDIRPDGAGRLVITDKHVYRFDMASTVLVNIGDTVTRHQSLTDALQIFEFTSGEVPAGLQALSLGAGYVLTCLYGELVFENRELPLTVIEDDPSGMTRVEFPVGGFPADVATFFDEMHTRGVNESLRPITDCEECIKIRYPAVECGDEDRYVRQGTLAHFLDRRTVRVGEPTAFNLPRTINPLQFLISNILRNNAYLVRIRAAHLGAAGLGLHNLRHVQKLVPPHTAMLIMIDVTPVSDSVTVSNVTESIATFTAMNTMSTDVATVTDRPRLRLVAGRCR